MHRIPFVAFLGLLIVGACLAGTSSARTWYVTVDGSGDAPTIYAAMDSATAGDTVLLGPGTYELPDRVHMTSGVVLTSELGPTRTKLVPAKGSVGVYGIVCSLGAYGEVSGLWIEGFGDAGMTVGSSAFVHGNVFVNPYLGILNRGILILEQNTFIGGGVDGGADRCDRNIFWGETDYPGLSMCNDFLNLANAGGDAALNFSADPQFCGEPEDLFLQSDSPCAPGNGPLPYPCDQQVGALPVGCGEVSTEARSWGVLKVRYR
jgi:hypothetical protein